MTYLGTLVACLTGQIEPKSSYFTQKGSCHAVEYVFPDLLHKFHTPVEFKPIMVDNGRWQQWHDFSIKNFSRNDICIIREGWTNTDDNVWSEGINSLENSYAIISSPNSKLDWIYCWLNMADKSPVHLYKTLLHKSKFFPKIWNSDNRLKILPKQVKIDEMKKSMPSHVVRENTIIARPNFRFMTTDILKETFPSELNNFLKHNGIVSNLSLNISIWHNEFIALQQENLNRAKLLTSGINLRARGPFDEILQDYLCNNDPWTTEEHPT